MADLHNASDAPQLFGLLAQYDSEEALTHAAHEVKKAGYDKVDAYTPYPSEEVIHALGEKKSKVPLLVLIGGITGALVGFGLQYWTSVIDYPMNIGGRPYNSWPSFIVVTFELTILFSAATAVLGMLALNKLPMPYHPVFNVDSFAAASRDGFFLSIEADDPKFDRVETERFLRGLAARDVSEIEP